MSGQLLAVHCAISDLAAALAALAGAAVAVAAEVSIRRRETVRRRRGQLRTRGTDRLHERRAGPQTRRLDL